MCFLIKLTEQVKCKSSISHMEKQKQNPDPAEVLMCLHFDSPLTKSDPKKEQKQISVRKYQYFFFKEAFEAHSLRHHIKEQFISTAGFFFYFFG